LGNRIRHIPSGCLPFEMRGILDKISHRRAVTDYGFLPIPVGKPLQFLRHRWIYIFISEWFRACCSIHSKFLSYRLIMCSWTSLCVLSIVCIN